MKNTTLRRCGLDTMMMRVRNEYHLTATEGLSPHRTASELFACSRAALHYAIGHERSRAGARRAARLSPVRPHHAPRDAYAVRGQVPARRGSKPGGARVRGCEHRQL